MRHASPAKTLIIVWMAVLLIGFAGDGVADVKAINDSLSPSSGIYRDIITCGSSPTLYHSNTYFLVFRTLRPFVFKVKKLFKIALQADNIKSFGDQKRLRVFFTILLFSIFYQLARTSSERPFASLMTRK